VTDTSTPRPFDERAALQELEALAERIQATRRQRQEAVAEFESFVKGFREDRYQELIAAQAARSSAPPASGRTIEPRPAPPPEPPKPVASAAALTAKAIPTPLPPILPAALPRESASASRAERPSVDIRSLLDAPRARLAVAALAVAALVVIGAWLWNRSPNAAPARPVTPSPAARTEPPPATTPQAVASTGPVNAAPPRALNMELITLRPVWTRVVVDGQKMVERELPKDSRIPVSGDRAIAIRAGDAGAIRVTINGKDQGVLGRDGQIAARTWTAPPAPAR
jgi:hypothetical protein